MTEANQTNAEFIQDARAGILGKRMAEALDRLEAADAEIERLKGDSEALRLLREITETAYRYDGFSTSQVPTELIREAEKLIEGSTKTERLGGMVLVFQPELTHSVWQDYYSDDAGNQVELENELRQGVIDGRWVGWRVIRRVKEVLGNDEIALASIESVLKVKSAIEQETEREQP